MAQEKKKRTSVEEYRQQIAEPKEVALPSGAVFIIRRLTPIDYIKEGLADIPNEFLQFIAELQAGVQQAKPEEVQKKNYELFERFLQITLEKGVIEPPVTLRWTKESQETHLVFSELNVDDQQALINAIMGRP
jgi:hypothetical protein